MVHIAGGVFLGIVAAVWFLSFCERRKAAKAHRAGMALLYPAPLSMSIADQRDFDGPMRWMVFGGLAFCAACLAALFV